jgi:L-aspartate oxidase
MADGIGTPKEPRVCDLLVLGSGIAGLRGAVEAALHGWHVLVATKDKPRESNTEYAQGGIAVSLSEEDDPERHVQDTLAAGDGLCRENAVRVLVEDGRALVRELIDWGAAFDRVDGRLHYTMEAAHSRRRILHAYGDSTGAELERALTAKAASLDRISVLPFHTGLRLIADEGECDGAWVLDESDNRPVPVFARAVLVATGGVGRVFQESTNPAIATGDGMALALEQGLVMSDLEFVQFHPTALFMKDAPRFLLSESLRGEGAVLRNANGQRFMDRYCAQGELAPRDEVTRAIVSEIRKQGGRTVTLDMTHLQPDFIRRRFPTIYSTLLELGLDISRQPIPVHPAAHYIMGGVETDVDGRTSMRGVYAAGETACTGVHGANRLASNSLLEGLVFGYRAARAALAEGRSRPPASRPPPPDLAGCRDLETVNALRRRIASIMWEGVGILRSGEGIARARGEMTGIRDRLRDGHFHRRILETANMVNLGDAIAACAEYRTESRGGHYRVDCPETDDVRWKRHTRLIKEGEGFRFLEDVP